MKKIIPILLSIFIIITLSSCTSNQNDNENNNPPPDESKISVDDTSFNGYSFEQIAPSNSDVTYDLIKMQNDAMKELGVYGDGCQWEVALESSKSGDLMLYGLDVAGMYRSLDHGKTWQMCNNGFRSRGAGMFAIDPFNSNHVLALGIGNNPNGIHISTDMAKTFTPTFSITASGHRYLWDGLEFDPTSYDSTTKETTDVYFSTPYNRDRAQRLNAYKLPALNSRLSPDKAGLYKSTDGGRNFTLIQNNELLADGIIKITDDGNIFIGNQHGLFHVSENGDILHSWLLNDFDNYEELTQVQGADVLKCNLGITGLDCVGNTIYAQTWDGIYIISTSDYKENIIESTNYPNANWPQFLSVSKSNPAHMILQARRTKDGAASYWSTYVYTSLDGGKTFTKASANANSFFTGGSWSGREKLFIIDPANDETVISFASDTLAISHDSGFNFMQVNGISNMMVGGKIHNNYYNPELMFFGAQDYSSVLSLDGGKTFKRIYVNVNGSDYGNLYGGFAADEKTFFGFADADWYDEHKLVVTHDGGKTWIDTGFVSDTLFSNNYLSSLQSYNNKDVFFAGEYYSKNHGYTWKKMNGCSMVYDINYTKNHEIYGTNDEGNIVVSYDEGDTWKIIFDDVLCKYPTRISSYIGDLAYDFNTNSMYVLDVIDFDNNGSVGIVTKIFKVDLNNNTFKELRPIDDKTGYELYRGVEIDPNSTNVLYVCSSGNSFNCASSLQRSIDGGDTFSILTASHLENKSLNDGGYEVTSMYVDPTTGNLIYGSGCYGFGKVNPPYNKELNHKKVKHQIKYTYQNKILKEITLNNNAYLEYYLYDIDGYTLEGWYFDDKFTKRVDDEFSVDNSYVLYAKLEKSEQISFYVGNEIVATMDLDIGFSISSYPKPEKEGYTFAGWYVDKDARELFDYKKYTTSVSVYAGFYKTTNNLYDTTSEDVATFIRYEDHKIGEFKFIGNDEIVDNRSAYMELEKNKTYLISLRMSNRARIALTDKSFWQYNVVPYYEADFDDANTLDIVDKDVYFTILSNDYIKLLLFYYTDTEGIDYKKIKNSIRVYEVIDSILYFDL